MTLFEELKRRGLISQLTREKEIEEYISNNKVPFYIGYDATADSLHIGHLLQLTIMRRFQLDGHKPIVLLGTGTTVIGDPTGKSDMRKMLSNDEINANAEKFKIQMSRFLDFGESDNSAEIVKNGDWLLEIKYLEFLRDVGVYFSVNKMLSADCFKTRFEREDGGLNFIELNYMLLQSYDFLHLFRTKGVRLELGGSDQWSNIIAGADLIRRVENEDAYGLTFTLLLNKDGKKMGKTEKGAVWLGEDKLSVYEFFQFFRNVDDSEVINFLKLLTFIPIEEIEALDDKLKSGEENINKVKELLAYELTSLVHGKEKADKALEAAKSAFGGNADSDNIPTTEFDVKEINAADLLVATGLCSSKRDARTNIEQGGVTINGEKIIDPNSLIDLTSAAVIKKGKKSFHKAIFKSR